MVWPLKIFGFFSNDAACRRGVLPVVLAVTIALLCSATVHGAEYRIQGIWKGKYFCRQGVTGLTLTISGTDHSQLTANFKFYAVPENSNVPNGEFEMVGQYDEQTGYFDFHLGQWILRPKGYSIVGLKGVVDTAEENLAGRVAHSDCKDFLLSRVSSKTEQSKSTDVVPRNSVPKSNSAPRKNLEKILEGK